MLAMLMAESDEQTEQHQDSEVNHGAAEDGQTTRYRSTRRRTASPPP